jgi:hypothetical protein
VQRVDGRHVFGIQREVEHIQVLAMRFRLRRPRDNNIVPSGSTIAATPIAQQQTKTYSPSSALTCWGESWHAFTPASRVLIEWT